MTGKKHSSDGKLRAAWRDRWKWALACFLLGPLAGYGFARLLPETYTSSATLGWNGAQLVPSGGEPMRAEFAAREISALEERILTPERLAGLIEQNNLYAPQRGPALQPDRVTTLRRNLAVLPTVRGIQVSFSAADPRLARQVCAGIVALFLEQNAPPGGDDKRAAAALLAAQFQEAKHRLDQAEARQAEFKRRHAGELDAAKRAKEESSLAAAKAQFAETTAALDRAVEDKSLAETLLREQGEAWRRAQTTGAEINPALEQELATKQAQLAALETRYTPDYPDVVKLRKDIAQIQQKLSDARAAMASRAPQSAEAVSPGEPAQITQTRMQIREFERAIQEKTRERQRLEQVIQAAASHQAFAATIAEEYEALDRSHAAAQSDYEALLAKQKQAEAASQQQRPVARFEVLTPPGFPQEPTSPNRWLFALGGAGCGLGLGLLAILVAAWSDTTLHTPAEVERYLQLPVLAILPTTGGQAGSVKEGERGAGRRGDPGAREESVLADV